jgi:hypothetical protein
LIGRGYAIKESQFGEKYPMSRDKGEMDAKRTNSPMRISPL